MNSECVTLYRVAGNLSRTVPCSNCAW